MQSGEKADLTQKMIRNELESARVLASKGQHV